jgi:hypothetical protein
MVLYRIASGQYKEAADTRDYDLDQESSELESKKNS